MAHTNIEDAEWKIGTRDKNVPWYTDSFNGKLGDAARTLLENYSKIPADKVESHILEVRDEAWQVWPYPCIGQFRFLELSISLSPYYPDILERLKKNNEKFLDLGCCFGQDIRKLTSDGAPSDHMYGSDLRSEFFDLGYKMFKDKDSLKTKFIQGDIFDSSSALGALDGDIDIIYVSSFLHLFGYDTQVQICQRIVKLMRDKKGSLVLGQQVGRKTATEVIHKTNAEGKMYQHDATSFQKMWDEVGELTGSKWRVDAVAKEANQPDRFRQEWRSPDLRVLMFAVFRE